VRLSEMMLPTEKEMPTRGAKAVSMSEERIPAEEAWVVLVPIRASRAERKRNQSRNRAAGRNQQLKDTPPGKIRLLYSSKQGHGKGRKAHPPKRMATWCFPAFSTEGDLVWLRATMSQHVPATRIMHQAAMRLGLQQNTREAYKVQLRRGSSQPEHVLQAKGIETLECMRPRAEREYSMILQQDVIVGWRDWERLGSFMFSGWTIPGVPVGAAAPASKWHLRVILRGSPPVYLNVQLDPQRRRTTITQEAAVRVGQTFHSFCMIFARAELAR
jgi:hypothetical protein